eukprot:TRINITY_DN72985_c0_g1_i1.p1 TRINITY_DN72985_c0_g1~~TRINITY_DN72985_c0_g1_i1.p1  ORF type:complete len:225 (+),score=40.80 TRINITY_DN72985_c0_g1_i1:30-704(+)
MIRHRWRDAVRYTRGCRSPPSIANAAPRQPVRANDPQGDKEIAEFLTSRHLRNFGTIMIAHDDKWALLNSEFSRLQADAGPRSFLVYLSIVGNQGRFRTAWATVRKMEEKSLPITEGVCARLLLSTLNGGNLDGRMGFPAAREYSASKGHPLGLKRLQRQAFSLRVSCLRVWEVSPSPCPPLQAWSPWMTSGRRARLPSLRRLRHLQKTSWTWRSTTASLSCTR